MTHNTNCPDNSARVHGELVRKYITSTRHERTTSAVLLSAMLEQDSVPALRAVQPGNWHCGLRGRPAQERNVEHRAWQDDPASLCRLCSTSAGRLPEEPARKAHRKPTNGTAAARELIRRRACRHTENTRDFSQCVSTPSFQLPLNLACVGYSYPSRSVRPCAGAAGRCPLPVVEQLARRERGHDR